MHDIDFGAIARTYPDYVDNDTGMTEEDWLGYLGDEIEATVAFVGDTVSGPGSLDLLLDLKDTCDNAAEADLSYSATWKLRSDIIRHVLAHLD